jgi:hypothetical protein
MALQATLRAEYDTTTAQLAAAEHECTRLTQDLAVAQGTRYWSDGDTWSARGV